MAERSRGHALKACIGEWGEAITEALTRANFSGKVQGASLFELLEPEGGGAIRRTRAAGGDPTRRGGGRFNRLALAELHRWPACKSRLAVAAAAAGAARLSRHSG